MYAIELMRYQTKYNYKKTTFINIFFFKYI